MIKFLLSVFLLLTLVDMNLTAQEESAKKGEIIVQLSSDFSIMNLIDQMKVINQKTSNITIKKELSKDLKLWLLTYKNPLLLPDEVLEAILSNPLVLNAQFNRKLENRNVIPNDSLFINQWQYVNNGSSGGLVDADIDMDDAWQISTGGITSTNDTIVIAVIDDGIDTLHPEFKGILWVNKDEIPSNGIDDDSNGYKDDYRGWNSYIDNDDITDGAFGGGHGTCTAGIIGAKGNNITGVSGVNWNVKLMIVVGGGDEADAVAAYSYVYKLRKQYNESKGKKGAYIVASNSSWGLDLKFSKDAPIWCAMYDSMGKQGILNVGSTTNSDRNVDTDGDLPSTCPSKYLIIATNTNNQDLKVTSSGYGKINVDLGAPGKNVFTTADTKHEPSGYKYFSGTSASAPLVAGVTGILYSAACKGLIELGKQYPDSISRLMRQFILQGVDPNGSLKTYTSTEGRLNAYRSVVKMQEYCRDVLNLAEQPAQQSNFLKQIYPNPVDEILTIEFNSLITNPYEITISNVFGMELIRIPVPDFSENKRSILDLRALPPGFYLLSFIPENNNIETLFFIKL